jgi:hypothetical protein
MRQGQILSPEAGTAAEGAHSLPHAPAGRLAKLGAAYDLAARVWDEHQADRAWLEWGVCWPPLSVRRPRCVSCGAAWPCTPALGADEQMTSREADADIE